MRWRYLFRLCEHEWEDVTGPEYRGVGLIPESKYQYTRYDICQKCKKCRKFRIYKYIV